MTTAMEWLIEQWPILESQIPPRILEQAKEMEKQQIIQASCCGGDGESEAEQYYNKTFKSE